MNFELTAEQQQIRDSVLKLCAQFDDAYWLARDEEIQGVPCMSTGGVLRTIGKALARRNQGGVFFHENGNLSSALVARDCVVQGRAFKRGELIRLDRDGNVQQ